MKNAVLTVCFGLFAASLVLAQPSMQLPEYHKNVPCQACHFEGMNVPPSNKQCLACHGSFDELVKKTEHYSLNPHMSPHWGKNINCVACHKQHNEPQVYCAACHTNQNYKIR